MYNGEFDAKLCLEGQAFDHQRNVITFVMHAFTMDLHRIAFGTGHLMHVQTSDHFVTAWCICCFLAGNFCMNGTSVHIKISWN